MWEREGSSNSDRSSSCVIRALGTPVPATRRIRMGLWVARKNHSRVWVASVSMTDAAASGCQQMTSRNTIRLLRAAPHSRAHEYIEPVLDHPAEPCLQHRSSLPVLPSRDPADVARPKRSGYALRQPADRAEVAVSVRTDCLPQTPGRGQPDAPSDPAARIGTRLPSGKSRGSIRSTQSVGSGTICSASAPLRTRGVGQTRDRHPSKQKSS